MFKDQSLKSKLALVSGLIFCSNFFLSLPLRSASALAAWAITSNGILKLRTSSGTKLDAFFQSSTNEKGERVWIDFPGELSRPRTLKGNGSVKEIRLGKPSKGKTRLVIEFLPSEGFPNLISFTVPLPFKVLGLLNSPGKSIHTLSPLSFSDD